MCRSPLCFMGSSGGLPVHLPRNLGLDACVSLANVLTDVGAEPAPVAGQCLHSDDVNLSRGGVIVQIRTASAEAYLDPLVTAFIGLDAGGATLFSIRRHHRYPHPLQ